MARVKGGYLGGTYDIPKKQPLDSRMLVTKRVDLINPSVWKTNGSTTGESGHYNGMIVSVSSDGIYSGVYYLTDRTAITDENYAAYKTALAAGEDVEIYFSMWTKLGTVNNSVVALRRDNDYNYKKIENTFIPVNGEVCLVDVAGYGLRTKVGDGISTFAPCFTDRTTVCTKKKSLNINCLSSRKVCKRSSTGNCINGHTCNCHAGESNEHKYSCCDSGVNNVEAKTAEKALNNNDCKK